MMVRIKFLGFFSLRLLRREGPGGGLQDFGLQGVCWGGGSVPQLPRRGVGRPHRSTPGVPPLPLRQRAGSPSPPVPPSVRPALPSLALGFLPSNGPHLSGPAFTSLPRRTQGSGLAGRLPVASHPRHGPAGPPPTCGPGCGPPGSGPRSVAIARPLQAQPSVPPQRHQGFSSQSPVLFLSFHLFLLISL